MVVKIKKERQRSLFGDTRTIDERFRDWIKENPHVWAKYKELAHEVRATGRQRYSSDILVARLRWHFDIESKGASEFKLNDHFTSRLARKLIAEDSSFEGFFELRELRSE